MPIKITYTNEDSHEYDSFAEIINCNLVSKIICTVLKANELISLPNMNFPNLEEFNCSNNQLTSLPYMNFPNLKGFSCKNNKLTSLPACILNFKNLECFHHHCNEYTDLSPQMEQFIDIKKDQGYIKRDLCFTDDLNVIKLLLEEGSEITHSVIIERG